MAVGAGHLHRQLADAAASSAPAGALGGMMPIAEISVKMLKGLGLFGLPQGRESAQNEVPTGRIQAIELLDQLFPELVIEHLFGDGREIGSGDHVQLKRAAEAVVDCISVD